jgi:hypothetical protein
MRHTPCPMRTSVPTGPCSAVNSWEIVHSSLSPSPSPSLSDDATDRDTDRAKLSEVWGASKVLSLILAGNSVCQEIAVATPLELPMMSDKVTDNMKLTLEGF